MKPTENDSKNWISKSKIRELRQLISISSSWRINERIHGNVTWERLTCQIAYQTTLENNRGEKKKLECVGLNVIRWKKEKKRYVMRNETESFFVVTEMETIFEEWYGRDLKEEWVMSYFYRLVTLTYVSFHCMFSFFFLVAPKKIKKKNEKKKKIKKKKKNQTIKKIYFFWIKEIRERKRRKRGLQGTSISRDNFFIML